MMNDMMKNKNVLSIIVSKNLGQNICAVCRIPTINFCSLSLIHNV